MHCTPMRAMREEGEQRTVDEEFHSIWTLLIKNLLQYNFDKSNTNIYIVFILKPIHFHTLVAGLAFMIGSKEYCNNKNNNNNNYNNRKSKINTHKIRCRWRTFITASAPINANVVATKFKANRRKKLMPLIGWFFALFTKVW